MCVGSTTAATIVVVVVVVVVVLAAAVDSQASNAVLPRCTPSIEIERNILSPLRWLGSAARTLRAHIRSAGPYIGARETSSIWYSCARASERKARAGVCAQKNRQGVFCERDTQTHAYVGALGERMSPIRVYIRSVSRGHAAPQELQQFRKATTMIAVEGNRLQALKIRPTMPNVEEELANAPTSQKLFRSLLS